jgi:hypothetical protein
MPPSVCSWYSVPAFTALFLGASIATAAAEPPDPPLERGFDATVRPFLKEFCLGCHGGETPRGKLDLSGFASVEAVAKDVRLWSAVLERLEAEEMPPEDAKAQPAPHQRLAAIEWFQALRHAELRRTAGDPGPVRARRLSNAEFDYTIRDLTGVDIRPTREFPVDPANEAGFDNSGESLTMSPALVKKYLEATRRVADHLVLRPDGLDFAPHPVVTETDRDKYCVRRILDFYDRRRVKLSDYFLAAWRIRTRAGAGPPAAGLSARYLDAVVAILHEPAPPDSPLGQLQALWRDLPANPAAEAEARRGCEAMQARVEELRKPLAPAVGRLKVRGMAAGSQPLVLWWNRQVAGGRMSGAGGDLTRDRQDFCRVFPDAFFETDRPPYFDARARRSGRPLTAGFHLMQGYFRDDQPLTTLVLDEPDRRRLDTLWRELNFITLAPIRQFKDFIFFEREEPPMFMRESRFDFARSEDRDSTAPAKVERLRAVYLARTREMGASDTAIEAIEAYFADMLAEFRRIEETRLAAEPIHLAALQAFAGRAYRRPLEPAERDELAAFYRNLRAREGLGHEDAVRDTLVSVLLSPHFCYRVDPAEPGTGARPLAEYALASRLSYFLWSSMPDAELLEHAAAGDLHTPEVLLAQTRRLLADERVRGLAVEFAGNWLGFRRFEEHNGVDRERFAGFTNELRQAMYEEPIRFVVDLARRNRPVFDLLDADRTFVNPVLARHYGIPLPEESPAEAWVEVVDVGRVGRGGLLPMAVFLTANSPGLRTSPVKRGYWVVRRLLGEHIPPPPPDVPELPRDEAQPGDLTLTQLLARHRANRSCAGCHQRFDSIGLVFEGYGPIGERRQLDLGGRPVDPRATFPDGTQGEGLGSLRRYLAERRREEFVGNLCRKLFAYALGRGLMISDEPALDEMHRRLAADGHRFGGLVESIVTTPQFLNRRGKDDPREQ